MLIEDGSIGFIQFLGCQFALYKATHRACFAGDIAKYSLHPTKMAPKVLVVLTSQDKIPANGHPTGWFLVCVTLGPILHYRYNRLTIIA
jgi:hypothetical protein